MVRVDRQAPVRLGATPVRATPDGFKVYRGVATFGDVVLDYPDLSPPRSEFVPASEALSPEAVASLLNMPFSIEHPPDLLTPETAREHVVGTVIFAEADFAARPPALLVEVMVWDAAAQEDIESGRMCELSPGYRCEEDVLLGSHGGKRYQVVQRRRRYNHLSGVSSARSVTADGRRARLDEAAGSPVGRRADGRVVPPTVNDYDLTRHDGALRTASSGDLPAGFGSAPLHDYAAGEATGWAGWSEGASWVAFWPTDSAAIGLLWTVRGTDGAVVGDPLAVPPSTRPVAAPAYPPRDMADIQPQPDDTKTTAPTRTDAKMCDALSPEDAEIVKTLSPEAQALVAAALGGGMASSEASGAGMQGEPVAPTPPAGSPDVAKMFNDLLKAIQDLAAMKAGGEPAAPTDAAPAAPLAAGKGESKDAPPKMDAQAQPLDAEAIIRQAREATARETDARIEAHARMVGAVRRDGHADVDTVADAAKVMLVTVGNHLPDLKSMAEEHLKAGRMDALAVLYKQAENVRRDGLLDSQGRAVSLALAGASDVDGSGATSPITSTYAWRPPAVRGA